MKFFKFGGSFALAVAMLVGTSGCRPYEQPNFVDVEPNETAFVIPMDGDITDQKLFASKELMDKYKVASKRIRITMKWVATGYFWWQGKYLPAIRVIKVDRAPETREWTDGEGTGTSQVNQAMYAETSDPTPFTARMNCTAEIQESDTALFLYKYAGRPLDKVIDLEVRNRIQSVFTEEAARIRLVKLTSSKSQLMTQVRNQVIPYFKRFGLTITNLGLQGEFTYPEKVRDALNEVLLANQRLQTQRDENLRLQMATRALTDPKAKEAQRLAWAHEERMAFIKALHEGKAQMPYSLGGNGNFIMQMMPQSSAQAEQPQQ